MTISSSKTDILNRIFVIKSSVNAKTDPSFHDYQSQQLSYLRSKLRSLKFTPSSKASNLPRQRPDGISARVLCECAAELTPSLASLFCFSLIEEQVPTEWKHGRVTACHKVDAKKIWTTTGQSPSCLWSQRSWKKSLTNVFRVSSVTTRSFLIPVGLHAG